MKMRLQTIISQVSVFGLLIPSVCATAWGFSDGSISVQNKGASVGAGLKEKFTPNKPLSRPIAFGSTDILKIILTAQEEKAAKKPDQVYVLLQDATSGLDVSYPLNVKENGKATVSLAYKDLPTQFLRPESKVNGNIVIASFGKSTGYNSQAFTLDVKPDHTQAASVAKKALRYGKLPEIHHIFRPDPKSPNVVISFVFTIAALATLPVLLGAWLFLGANVKHVSQAMSDAPVAHGLFVGSIALLEGILFMYYTSWNLFQTLPALLGVGLVTFVSGSRALTEVQERRLAGLR